MLEVLRETWLLVLESAPLLLGGFVLAGLIHEFVPTDRVVRCLGKPDWWSVLKAAAIGTPLPLCSCAVVPVAAQLRQAGASRGATTAFLISTPESGVDSIAITYALLDPVMTIGRPVAAFLTAFVAGIAENVWGAKEPASQAGTAEAPEAPCSAENRSAVDAGPRVARPPADGDWGCSAEVAAGQVAPAAHIPESAADAPAALRRFGARCHGALRYGLIEMLEDLGPYLAAGFLIGGVLSVALRTFDPLRLALGSPWAPLVMLAAGIPMYVCASAATPMIAVLIREGLAPGAGLVFLLAGPATNAASLVLLHRVLGRRGVVIYLAAIVGCALAAGFGVSAVYAATGWTPRALVRAGACATGAAWYEFAAAGVLLACTAHGLYRRYGSRARREALRAGSDPE